MRHADTDGSGVIDKSCVDMAEFFGAFSGVAGGIPHANAMAISSAHAGSVHAILSR